MTINVLPEDFENLEWIEVVKDIIKKASSSMDLKEGEISIKLVDDGEMTTYNEKYTNREGTTDVLAFPLDSGENPEEDTYYGDIIISTDRLRKQAENQGHSRVRELKTLTLHGFLHLLGYNHEEDTGEMKNLERKLLTDE